SALGVVNRLLSGAVTRQEQRARRGVPQRDPEHAPQPGERRFLPLVVCVDDGLRVARCQKPVAEQLQLSAQFAVVVDLAVEDDPHRARFVVNRLAASREIDDAEAAHAEADAGLDVDTLVVWTAVSYDVAHAMDERERGWVGGDADAGRLS